MGGRSRNDQQVRDTRLPVGDMEGAPSHLDAAMEAFLKGLDETRQTEIDFYRGAGLTSRDVGDVSDPMLEDMRQAYRQNPDWFSGPGKTLGDLAEEQGLNKPLPGGRRTQYDIPRTAVGSREPVPAGPKPQAPPGAKPAPPQVKARRQARPVRRDVGAPPKVSGAIGGKASSPGVVGVSGLELMEDSVLPPGLRGRGGPIRRRRRF